MAKIDDKDNDKLENLAQYMAAHGMRTTDIRRVETFVDGEGIVFRRTVRVERLGYRNQNQYREANWQDIANGQTR